MIRLEDISDDDDDYREFKASLAKAKDDIQNFRASRIPEDQDDSLALGFKLPDGGQPGTPSGRGRNRLRGFRPRGGFRGERGPRKAAEPTGDIKLRLGKASEAFIAGNYQEARAIVTEVIRINAETHEAWTILATIFQELGETDKSLTALTYAATLRPKHVAGWLNCARVFLEQTGKHRSKYLSSAFFCYASAIRADPKGIEGRLGKAKIYIERNNPAGAISEYKTVLKIRPHDLEVVRSLCAAYFDQGEVENAKKLYKQIFARFKTDPSNSEEDALTWSDVDSYIAIYEYLGQLDAAIKELKSLSRWLMGRDTEEFWDNISSDDREWDSDSSRRIEVPGFEVNRFPLSTYGDGLPLELRTKLGLCRLGLGHHDEAMVSYVFSSNHVLC
jgi:general transcription factor 3C polypeptide 3 (transcription factor C subunit 4)